MRRLGSPLVRYEGNPIIEPQDMPFECYAVFNAGAIRFNGKYLLLLRVEDWTRTTNFHVATSHNGFDFTVNPEPISYPKREKEEDSPEARFDMRITFIEGVYYVCHALAVGSYGCCIGMAKTTDFVNFESLCVSVPSNRNAALFPEKINGRYARLERPQDTSGGGRMWVSYSPDLIHWGDALPLNMPLPNWARIKTGAGIVPIRTEKGWLEIYHATARTASSENYHLGVMLLDLNDPSKVVSAPMKMILAAEKDYECMGQVPNVVFTCGAIETDDGKLNVYYGGADTRMCVAQTTIEELLDFCEKNHFVS